MSNEQNLPWYDLGPGHYGPETLAANILSAERESKEQPVVPLGVVRLCSRDDPETRLLLTPAELVSARNVE